MPPNIVSNKLLVAAGRLNRSGSSTDWILESKILKNSQFREQATPMLEMRHAPMKTNNESQRPPSCINYRSCTNHLEKNFFLWLMSPTIELAPPAIHDGLMKIPYNLRHRSTTVLDLITPEYLTPRKILGGPKFISIKNSLPLLWTGW